MVRGFGLTLGRKAANRVTRPSQTKVVNDEPTFSKRQMELIQEYESIKKSAYETLKDCELYYTNGKITEGEYNIIKSKANDQLVEINQEIDKLKEPVGKQDQYTAAFGGLNSYEFISDGRVLIKKIRISKNTAASASA